LLWIAALALGLVGLAPSPAPAAPGTDGNITGTLLDGTRGGEPQPNARVHLYWTKGEKEQPKRSARTDAKGVFRFDGLPSGPEYTYVVYTNHDRVEYITGRIKLDKEPTQRVKLEVYGATNDDSPIRIRSSSVVVLGVDKTTQAMFVLETHMFTNPTKRTWTPTTDGPKGPMGLLRFSIPGDATSLRPMGELGSRTVIQNDRGFGTDLPIRPGDNEVSFTYQLPYRDPAGVYSFSKTASYPTDQFRLLLPQGGPAASSPQLRPGDPAPLWGDKYNVLSADGVQAREKLDLSFSGLPVNVYPLRPDNRWLWAGAAGTLALLLGLALALWRRNARRASVAVAEDGYAGERDTLVRELAGLDARYETGALDEQSYRRERETRKQRLLTLFAAAPRPE
jgi:hypothetical protein